MRPGETIYKGHHSYDLMRNLQMGIIFSIAKSVEQPTGRGLKAPVTDEDFAQQVCYNPHACACSSPAVLPAHFCACSACASAANTAFLLNIPRGSCTRLGMLCMLM